MKEFCYNDVISELEDFCKRHLQINSFISTQTYDFQTKKNVYTCVICNPTLSSVVNTSLELNLDLYIADKINEDGSNSKDVYDDTLSIAKDFVAYFSNRNKKWNFRSDSISIEPFEEKFDDVLGGWKLSVVVVLPFRKNACEIPFRNDEPPTPFAPMADFTYSILMGRVNLINKSKYYEDIQWVIDGCNEEDIDCTNENLVVVTFPTSGNYTITIKASKPGFEPSTCTKTITI